MNFILEVAVGSFYIDFLCALVLVLWYSLYIVTLKFFSFVWIVRPFLLIIFPTNVGRMSNCFLALVLCRFISVWISLLPLLSFWVFCVLWLLYWSRLNHAYILPPWFHRHYCFDFWLLVYVVSWCGFSFYFGSSKLKNYSSIISF